MGVCYSTDDNINDNINDNVSITALKEESIYSKKCINKYKLFNENNNGLNILECYTRSLAKEKFIRYFVISKKYDKNINEVKTLENKDNIEHIFTIFLNNYNNIDYMFSIFINEESPKYIIYTFYINGDLMFYDERNITDGLDILLYVRHEN